MSGLSIWSLVTIVSVSFGIVSNYISQWYIWLIAGALYFPCVLILSFIRRNKEIKELHKHTRIHLILTSFMEWTMVMFSFVFVGKMLGLHFPLNEVMVLYIASTVIGICSLIPGGLGSFDMMMIIGLSHLGISKEMALAWLLLYRVAYYFVPFIIGLILFVHSRGHEINEEYDGAPKKLVIQLLHKLNVFLLYFSGITLCLLAAMPNIFSTFKWFDRISPWSTHFVAQSPKLVLAFVLLMLGRSFANRVNRAFEPAVLLLVASFIYLLIHQHPLQSVIFVFFLIILAFLTRSQLYREQLVLSQENLLMDGTIYAIVTLTYLGIGIYNLPNHHHRVINNFLLFPSERLWLAGMIAVILVSIVILIFYRYLEGEKKQVGSVFDKETEEKVYHVLENYGGNTESHLVFLKDKRVYFLEIDDEPVAFLQFSQYKDKAIVMSEPSGDKQYFPELVKNFVYETDTLGYSAVFYEVTEDIAMYLHEFGYDFFKMGEEAHVDLTSFTLQGKKQRGLRATMNKIEKTGIQFEMMHVPYAKEDLDNLREVSDEWLDGRKEKGFSLGFYSEEYLMRAPIAVARNEEGEIIAFASIMPTYTEKVISIDLMRYKSEAPSGIMDYLFIKLFEYYRDEGYTYFNLGMAPLANVGNHRHSFITERFANILYIFGSKIYSFQGLKDYKSKYATSWKSRYTMYSRKRNILFVMYSLFRVDDTSVEKVNSKN